MDIKKTKENTAPAKKTTVTELKTHQKNWISGYLVIGFICLALYFLVQLNVVKFFGANVQLLKKLFLGGFFAFVILFTGKVLELLITTRTQSKTLGYNLVRAVRLVTVLIVIAVVISFLFQNWYTAAVSLGLISLILGFALQVPISSFIAWLYIIFRTPYRVGDRIQITEFKGDVVEIGYLDTTLWEFGGEYLTNDNAHRKAYPIP